MTIKGKIICTIKPTHPDYKCLIDKYKGKRKYNFDDIYTFDDDWDKSSAITYIKNDLMLIAGGGYNIYNAITHIEDVSFEINEVVI